MFTEPCVGVIGELFTVVYSDDYYVVTRNKRDIHVLVVNQPEESISLSFGQDCNSLFLK